MATPDAIARSKHSELFPKWKEIHETYFRLHAFSHLDDFLKKQMGDNSGNGITVQITTHAPLLHHKKLQKLLQKSLGCNKDQITTLTLQQFDTEIDFCTRIR